MNHEPEHKLPTRICFLIWVVLAGAGWVLGAILIKFLYGLLMG